MYLLSIIFVYVLLVAGFFIAYHKWPKHGLLLEQIFAIYAVIGMLTGVIWPIVWLLILT